jgi:hypothetical protein
MSKKLGVKDELALLVEKLNQREDYTALRKIINGAVSKSGMSCLWVCKIEEQFLMSISMDNPAQSSSQNLVL